MTRTSTSDSALLRVWVRCSSAREGSATPDGWLWTRTMAARSYFEPLRKAGVQIYEYIAPMLHAKTLVVDDNYSLVGTANFDNRSFLLNFEIAVAILF